MTMIIGSMTSHDIDQFLIWTAREGWLADPRELEFLLETFPAGCLVSRDAAGVTTGFITALQHGRSGWIGNLLVSPEQRGFGIGGSLFQGALAALNATGVATALLTASLMGISLYQKHGFRRIDTIQRWTGIGRGESKHDHQTLPGAMEIDQVIQLDALAWGDVRRSMLAKVIKRGQVIMNDSGFVTIQSFAGWSQIGPCAAQDRETAAELLSIALTLLPTGMPVYVDVPAANRAAAHLLLQNGLRSCRENELMYRGEQPDYRPELIYGLATAGSCG